MYGDRPLTCNISSVTYERCRCHTILEHLWTRRHVLAQLSYQCYAEAPKMYTFWTTEINQICQFWQREGSYERYRSFRKRVWETQERSVSNVVVIRKLTTPGQVVASPSQICTLLERHVCCSKRIDPLLHTTWALCDCDTEGLGYAW